MCFYCDILDTEQIEFCNRTGKQVVLLDVDDTLICHDPEIEVIVDKTDIKEQIHRKQIGTIEEDKQWIRSWSIEDIWKNIEYDHIENQWYHEEDKK